MTIAITPKSDRKDRAVALYFGSIFDLNLYHFCLVVHYIGE